MEIATEIDLDCAHLSNGVLMDVVHDVLCKQMNPRDLIMQGPHFLRPGEDEEIYSKSRDEGARLLLQKAKERDAYPDVVKLLEKDYSHIALFFTHANYKDLIMMFQNDGVAPGQDEDDLKLLHLLRGELYENVEPREILPALLGDGFLSIHDVETILEKRDRHRLYSCIELVATLVRKKQKGSFDCLMCALLNIHLTDVVDRIDPDFREKIQKRGGEANSLSTVQTQDGIAYSATFNVTYSDSDVLGLERDPTMPPICELNMDSLKCDTALKALAATEPDTAHTSNAGQLEKLELRPYQMEVAQPALEGDNCIICMPTNSGKTVVAAHIIHEHLRSTPNSKVVFMAPRVALVNQHFDFFHENFKDRNVMKMTSESEKTFRLGSLIASYDIFVLTPQVLVDYLEENNTNSLSRFTLLIFDECHHCRKEDPYNKVMLRYLVDKLPCTQAPSSLPQVLGLSATLGVGDAKCDEEAVTNIIKLCANLDSHCAPVQVKRCLQSLQDFVSIPNEEQHPVCERKDDAYSRKIINTMKVIETLLAANLHNTEMDRAENSWTKIPVDRSSQAYQQWIVKNTKDVREVLRDSGTLQVARVGLSHLKAFCEALMIWRCVRCKDASRHLETAVKLANTELAKQLEDIFLDTKTHLLSLIKYDDDNPKLAELAAILKEMFNGTDQQVQGLIFVKERETTEALCAWLMEYENGLFKTVNPKPFTGAHAPADRGGLTSIEQSDILNTFRNGETRLLVCTSVVEEGLDIPDCSFVIRYLYISNEIATIQARGRVRQRGGIAHTINSIESTRKEQLNLQREQMMQRAMMQLSNIDLQSYRQQVKIFQKEAVDKHKMLLNLSCSQIPKVTQSFRLLCGSCKVQAVDGCDVRVYQNAHHIVTDETLIERISLKPHRKPVGIGGTMYKDRKMECKKCKQDWGIGMTMGGKDFFVVKIESFIVEGSNNSHRVYRRWKELPFLMAPIEESELLSVGQTKVSNV